MTDGKLKKITVALVGNPNSGKTSVFNMLTGASRHVANYPGTTVETVQGTYVYGDFRIVFVDLPGTYGLTTFSAEELVARNFIINEKPDIVLNVIDASNLERNLYLTTQLIELGVPIVLVFNMSDVAAQRGIIFDTNRLSALLESPIICTVANKSQGRIDLFNAIVAEANTPRKSRTHRITYGDEIEIALKKIEPLVSSERPALAARYGSKWIALKLLEQDSDVTAKVGSGRFIEFVNDTVAKLKTIFRDDPAVIIAEKRYGFISGACQESVKATVELTHTTSDLADAVLTHRLFGLPIFLLMMYLVFYLTFSIAPIQWRGWSNFSAGCHQLLL